MRRFTDTLIILLAAPFLLTFLVMVVIIEGPPTQRPYDDEDAI